MDTVDRAERARLARDVRERRRFSGYHATGAGLVVAILVGYALFAAWANASIWGWGSGLVVLVLVPGVWLVRIAVLNRASRVVRRTIDPGRGYSGRGVDR